MSEIMNKAIKLLKETSEEFGKLTDEIADNIEHEDFSKAHLAYLIAAALDVYASQLSGEEKVVEGKCEVYNGRAKITVNDISLRDKIHFEMFYNGKWHAGHRSNSQYGQTFYTKEGGQEHIITKDDTCRVTFPLKSDDWGM